MKNSPLQNDLSLKLQERVKELSCLYKVSNISQQLEVGLNDQVNRILQVIPLGWQYPRKLKVRLSYNDEEVGDELNGFGMTNLVLVNKQAIGIIEVEYTDDPQISFLKEEKQLLEQIAVQIGNLISRHEHIEQERLVNAKLRSEDRLHVLAELTAGVAHELNTPLGNILGYAEILERSIKDKQKKADARKIMKSAMNAREIVKKLMYFSCEMPSKKTKVDINKLVTDTCSLLSLQFKTAKIKIERFLPSSKVYVNGDTMQLSQVLINLLMNAKDASSGGQHIEIGVQKDKDDVLISVKDYGTGIDKEHVSQLFKPFFTNKKHGTGLGLSVAHGIIQSHGGTIEVKSAKGEESVFTITLKLAKDES
jgi:signal transduction histidine kinase